MTLGPNSWVRVWEPRAADWNLDRLQLSSPADDACWRKEIGPPGPLDERVRRHGAKEKKSRSFDWNANFHLLKFPKATILGDKSFVVTCSFWDDHSRPRSNVNRRQAAREKRPVVGPATVRERPYLPHE